jgi:hypothetical protein
MIFSCPRKLRSNITARRRADGTRRRRGTVTPRGNLRGMPEIGIGVGVGVASVHDLLAPKEVAEREMKARRRTDGA